MAVALHSSGTTLSFNGALGNVFKISRKGYKVKSVDATVLSSPDVHMEFIPGFADAGELTFSTRWQKTDFNTLYATVRTTYAVTLTFPNGSTWVCDGFITSLDDEVPEDDAIGTEVTIKFTGKPVYTPAA